MLGSSFSTVTVVTFTFLPSSAPCSIRSSFWFCRRRRLADFVAIISVHLILLAWGRLFRTCWELLVLFCQTFLLCLLGFIGRISSFRAFGLCRPAQYCIVQSRERRRLVTCSRGFANGLPGLHHRDPAPRCSGLRFLAAEMGSSGQAWRTPRETSFISISGYVFVISIRGSGPEVAFWSFCCWGSGRPSGSDRCASG